MYVGTHGYLEDTQVDVTLFVKLAASVLDVADKNGGNPDDSSTLISHSFAMFGCTFTPPIPPTQMEEQDGAVDQEFDEDDKEFGVEEEEEEV